MAMDISASTLVVAVEDWDLGDAHLVTLRMAPGLAPGFVGRHRLEARYPLAVTTDGRRAVLGAADGLWVAPGGTGHRRPLGMLWTPGRWRIIANSWVMNFMGDQLVVADSGASNWSTAAAAVPAPAVGRLYAPAVGR